MHKRVIRFSVSLLLVIGFGVSSEAASVQTNGFLANADVTWAELRTILAGLPGGDTVKISGDVPPRLTDDAAGGLTISAADVTFSGGWDAGFTTQAWQSQAALSDELPLYSTLDVNGDYSGGSDNRHRVLSITGTGVTVEGFKITSGSVYNVNGGGISLTATGGTLSHLYVTENEMRNNYSGGGGIFVNKAGTVMEYLTVTDNDSIREGAVGSTRGAGGIHVQDAVGSVLVALCHIEGNRAPVNYDASGGVGLHFYGPYNISAIWAAFGCVVTDNAKSDTGGGLSVGMAGMGDGYVYIANCTLVDNGGAVCLSGSGTWSWALNNYLINTILADTVGAGIVLSSSDLNFQNTLTDPETPALDGTYFDGTAYIDLGGNITATQPDFVNQAGGDYELDTLSPGEYDGLVKYGAGGLGFAYVDLDRDGSYDSGLDVIVDIIQGGGQYVPGAGERYYPTDMEGREWVYKTSYSSDAELVGSMSMGGVASPAPPEDPIIETSGYEDVDATTAKLIGNLVSTGAHATTVFLYYGTDTATWGSTNLGLRDPGYVTNSPPLLPDTTYYFSFLALNAGGDDWGATNMFTTPSRPVAATTFYVGGNDQGAWWWTGSWANLDYVLGLATVSGDVVNVSGDFTRGAGDTSGELPISGMNVTLSGGWDADFTGQAWKGKTALTDELADYSVLDVNGSDTPNNRWRVLRINSAGENALVEGFTLTGGYADASYGPSGGDGGGIYLDGNGSRISHCWLHDNESHDDYDGAGAIRVAAGNTILEYLTITDNYTGASGLGGPYGGALRVENAGNVMIANCLLTNNTSTATHSYGSAIEFSNSGSSYWTLFGSLVYGNPTAGRAAIGLSAASGAQSLVNCTVVDNAGGVRVAHEGGTANNDDENYIINCVLADTVECMMDESSGRLWFKNTLIDPDTPATGQTASYFDGTYFVDLGGNAPATQPLFQDQASGQYTLEEDTPAFGTGEALYDAGGLGFAYVDVNRDGNYEGGIDIIVDIIQGGGQYVPAANEHYYPTDIYGTEWISDTIYSSTADLVDSMNMGGVAGFVASSEPLTLKDGVDGYSGTEDTRINRSGSSEQFNFGVSKNMRMSKSAGWFSGGVIKFDLAPVLAQAPRGVKTVESAILRMYCYTNAGSLGTLEVNQMTEEWEEGSNSGCSTCAEQFDGAGCYARRAGTAMAKEALTATNHNATTLYYYQIDDLAVDPSDGDSYYVRRDNSTGGQFRNWDIANRDIADVADLDTLAAQPAGNDVYYYDEASGVIYFRRNAYGYRLFQVSDVWADSITTMGSAGSRGVLSGSYDSGNTYSDGTPDANWYEVDIWPIVSNWTVEGQANYGVRLYSTSGYNPPTSFSTSERTEKHDPVNEVWEGDGLYNAANGVDVRPELIIDFTPVPPPVCVFKLY